MESAYHWPLDIWIVFVSHFLYIIIHRLCSLCFWWCFVNVDWVSLCVWSPHPFLLWFVDDQSVSVLICITLMPATARLPLSITWLFQLSFFCNHHHHHIPRIIQRIHIPLIQYLQCVTRFVSQSTIHLFHLSLCKVIYVLICWSEAQCFGHAIGSLGD